MWATLRQKIFTHGQSPAAPKSPACSIRSSGVAALWANAKEQNFWIGDSFCLFIKSQPGLSTSSEKSSQLLCLLRIRSALFNMLLPFRLWLIETKKGTQKGFPTYVIPIYEKRNGKREVKKFVPITEFVDVEGLWAFFGQKAEELKNGKSRWKVLLSVAWNLRKFIDTRRAPKHLKIRRMLLKIILKRDYHSLGEFHYKALFLGMMHFMDLYNYDIGRVERCNIHYLTPDGRIIPFCAFNIFSDIYRDYIQKKYSLSLSEWAKVKGEDTIGDKIKYVRNIPKLKSSEVYRRAYEPFIEKYNLL